MTRSSGQPNGSLTQQAASLAIDGACRALRLPTVRIQHGELADAATRDGLTHRAFLAEVLGAEMDERDGRRQERRIADARRDGYQLLIQRVHEGGIAGIAVYDLSRLARNVRLMANLLHELDRQQIAIRAGNLPNTRMDSAVGRFMFHMLVSAAQFQRDLDSERMTAQMARVFPGWRAPRERSFRLQDLE